MTQVSIIQDVWDSLGFHLNQKDLKSGKKWPSYGQFTNLKSGKKQLSNGQFTSGRLCDSSKHHTGCMGSIRASFELKRSKIGQEMAELWPFYHWEVA